MDDATFAFEWEKLTPTDRKAMSQSIMNLKRQNEDATPGSLAQRLDPLTVQTPALDIIDDKLRQARNAISAMYSARYKFSSDVRAKVDPQEAIERIEREIHAQPDTLNRLIVSMPPQEGKSNRISIVFVIWLLRQFPGLKIGIVSYDGEKASEFTRSIRNLIELLDGTGGNIDLGLRLESDQKAMSRFALTSGSSVYGIGIGGGLTGRHFDVLIIDDPVKDARAADSVLLSQQAWEWWQTAARTRLAPGGVVIEVATRWHELDLGGRFITKMNEDITAGITTRTDIWEIVNIPAQADHDPSKGEVDILGRQPGEFMLSARGRTQAQWETTKNATDARFWSALFQGRPTPETGDILLKQHWRRYDTVLWVQQSDGTFRVPGYELSQSWDFAFRDTKSSDYVVGQVWAKKGPQSFLIYQIRARLSFTQSLEAMRRVSRLFPTAHRKIVEAKANGDAIIDVLKKELTGIIAVTPDQSKEARCKAVSVFQQAHNFEIPTTAVAYAIPELQFSPEDFIHECTSFPNGTHDDQVDAFSQYGKMLYIEGGEGQFLSPVGAGTRSRKKTTSDSPMARRLAGKK
jgi:predicted phage terminase large subunit-like protein